ncbi:MAG: aminotransferase class I/II-fold pyridoxal phosphate-dependent enzyme [Pseudomonadota bacterium]
MTRRLDKIAPFRVVEMLEQARTLERAGADVIHLEVGEPDFPTPQGIVEAGVEALRDGYTRYTGALGIPELRQAIADYYRDQLGFAVATDRVIVTAGASAGLQLAITAICDVGDGLLLPDPGYPCNEVFALSAGVEPQSLPTRAEDRFQPRPELLRAHWQPNTRAALLASPSNPVGSALRVAELAELAATVHGLGGTLLLDEIYQGLMFGQPHYATGLAVNSELVSINSFSKYFGMTGWRLGWLVVPDALVEPVQRLAGNLYISPSAPAQRAALAAFSEDTLTLCEARRLELVRRQQRLTAGLRELGFGIPVVPEGAFYVFADIAPLGVEPAAMAFCERLLKEAEVALAPGIDFGSNGTASMVRFACTVDLDRIDVALERIGAALVGWR